MIVDQLTKSAHFLSMHMTYLMEKLAQLYMNDIVRLHVVPMIIVLDRDPRFTSSFWKSLYKAMRTKLNFSTTSHPQTNG